ncbi:MAG: Glutamate-1-semialdehyde 2,1-aminomutase [Chlamydiae bacterium]|nr:Glutamate-1-semialdehyde 2,1-aminomutase [Chlamydiota bacterium]
MDIMGALREKSKEIYEASIEKMPGGVNSPVRSFPGLEMTPLVVDRGEGDLLIDVDGNQYIDYCLSWGALILGHAHKQVVERVKERVAAGSSFGTVTATELELACKICEHMPWIESLRFVSSGTEATMGALRLARGATGRKKIIKFIGNYHGSCDPLLVQAGSGLSYMNPTASSLGVPEEVVSHTVCLPYNDREALEECFAKMGEEIAAVILEPIAGNMGVVPATIPFMKAARVLTRESGSLLIVDEVITGFRVGLRGAQPLYGIEGDITCLGKVVGGGFPAAAFGGKRSLMDQLAPLGQIYHGGTLSGNPVAMVAGLETLKIVEKPGFFETLEVNTNLLTSPIRAYIESRELPITLNQVGSMFTLFFGPRKVESKEDLEKTLDHERFKRFFLHLFERGIYIPPSAYEAWFVSSAHTEVHLEKTAAVILELLESTF